MTPLQTHEAVKKEHPDVLVVIRCGDFYEVYNDDAKTCAAVLGLPVTTRNWKGTVTPMAGFPYHQLDLFLPRLVQAGIRVSVVTTSTP